MNQEKIYCFRCGEKLVKRTSDRFDPMTGEPVTYFDPMTGEPVTYMACDNIYRCEEGCGANGHDMRWPYWKCKRCGYRPPDYP